MDIRNEIKAFRKKQNKMSQNEFAKNAGISPSYLSTYMKEGEAYTYSENVERLANKYMSNYIQKGEENQDGLNKFEPPFLVTKDVRTIQQRFHLSVINDTLSIIIGVAGTGKTRTAEEWASKNPAKYVFTTKNMRPVELFELMTEMLGVRPTRKKSLDFLIRLCATRLKEMKDVYFIIDEAAILTIPLKLLQSKKIN